MKPSSRKNFQTDRGSVLLIALILAAVMALALASYAQLCFTTLTTSMRTQQSLHAAELCENGMEQALNSLNSGDWGGYAVSVGAGSHTANRMVTPLDFDNGVQGRIGVTVENYDGPGTRLITVTGTMTLPTGGVIKRTFQADARPATLFPNVAAAIGSSGHVNFSSGGTADSFDSSIATYAASTPGFAAVVTAMPATSDLNPPTVNLNNANIYGFVASRPMHISYSTSAVVSGLPVAISPLIDANRLSTSPYQPLFALTTPDQNIPIDVSPTTDNTIGDQNATVPTVYRLAPLGLNPGDEVPALTMTGHLTIDGPVILILQNDVTMNGGGSINLTTTKKSGQFVSSLAIYAEGSFTIGGGGINNPTEIARRVAVLGNSTDAGKLVTLDTTTPFYGAVYSPTQAIMVNGDLPIYGAVVGTSVDFSGNQPFLHYDLDLRGAVFPSVKTPFAVSNWREVPN